MNNEPDFIQSYTMAELINTNPSALPTRFNVIIKREGESPDRIIVLALHIMPFLKRRNSTLKDLHGLPEGQVGLSVEMPPFSENEKRLAMAMDSAVEGIKADPDGTHMCRVLIEPPKEGEVCPIYEAMKQSESGRENQ